MMRPEKIAEFVKRNVEPLPASPPYGERYRVAGTMADGTSLPCIVVESASLTVDLALKRFEQTKTSDDPHMGYRAIVRTFVTKGNTINDYDLRDLSISPYAIPLSRLREINGETSMSWTEFYAIMTDGEEFRFGTTYLTEFFDMPAGYSAANIARIVPAVRGEQARQEQIYREKPFFTCYVDGL
jgi:hypothetical protein